MPGLNKHLTKDTLSRLIAKADIQKEEKAVNNLISLGIDIFGTSTDTPPRQVSNSYNYYYVSFHFKQDRFNKSSSSFCKQI